MKKLLATFVCAAITLALTACSGNVDYEKTESKEVETPTELSSMFAPVEKANQWTVVYHKDTKVMYVATHRELLLNGEHRLGEFTVMLDCEGNPLLYRESVENVCKICNHQINDTYKFCPECGTKLTSKEQ